MRALPIILAITWTLSGGGAVVAAAEVRHTPPTFANVPYGTAGRQVLDFWRAASPGPAPVVLYIHGGGWVQGDKKSVETDLQGVQGLLDAGISVAAMNYRFIQMAQDAKVDPPVRWPLLDAARALQFLRSQAAAWNIDRGRIAASGVSAGGCSSLWLAFHDDLAQPASTDPIARESTRLACVAVSIAQTSLDPKAMREWTPNSRYGGHAFGLWDPLDPKTRDTRFDDFLARRQELLPLIREFSPIELASPDDPPVYLAYRSRPAIGKAEADPTHTANFGVKLQERLVDCKVSCELAYPGAPRVTHPSVATFLIDALTKAK